MATNSGGWLYEANGTPVDKATADNAQARVLEIKQSADTASTDAAKALQTAKAYAGQIEQANTTAGSAVAIAQGAEDTADNAASRVDALEVMGGVQPGSVNDAEMKLHAEQDGGLFNTALKAQIDERRFLVQGSLGPASDLIRARLDFRIGDMAVGVAGDSTANGPSDWPQQLAGIVANRCPWLRVVRKPWNQTSLTHDPDVVVQQGEGDPGFSGQIIHDTFTRTSGIANADTGGPWEVLNPGNWTLTGSSAHATGVANLSVDTRGRDMTSVTTIDLNATGTGTNQNLRIYHGSGYGVFLTLTVSSTGATTLAINRVNNSSATLIASPNLNTALGIPQNAPAGQLVITLDSQIQNQTVTLKYGTQTFTHSWVIPESIYALMEPSFALFPQGATPGIAITEADVSVADSPSTYQTLTFVEGSMGGGTLQYQMDNWDAMFGREVGELVDTFTRTGAINGSTANTGERWVGSPLWSADGAAAVPSGSGGVGVDLSGMTQARATVEMITSAPTATETFRLGALTVNDGVNGLFLSVSITAATGAVGVTPYVRTVGGGYRQFPQMTGHGIATNTSTPQNVDLSVSLDGLTMTTTVGGLTVANTITQAEAGELGTYLELRSASAGAGAHFRVLDVEADYAPEGAEPLDVMIIAHGHNYGARLGSEYIGILENFLDFMAARRPSTLPLLSSQNPQFSPSANPSAHADRQIAVRRYAMAHGITYAAAFERFALQPDGGKSWVLTDGVHPNATGYEEWARVVANLLA